MYVCGPTVYDLPHLGHGRYTLVFDVLRRYLLFAGLDVRYVSNVTDVDDNIIERANLEHRTEAEVAAQYEAEWWQAMDRLGVLRPTDIPHATAYVAPMVALVERPGPPGGGLPDVRRRLPERRPGGGLRPSGQAVTRLAPGGRPGAGGGAEALAAGLRLVEDGEAR